jgi:hypothetical protein
VTTSAACASSAHCRALLAPSEMLVTDRKRGSRGAAGSGGMQQPDQPSAGGVRLSRLRGSGSLRAGDHPDQIASNATWSRGSSQHAATWALSGMS